MRTKTVKSTWRPYVFRVPQELLDDLREQAKYEEDAINTMAVDILRAGIKEKRDQTRRILHKAALLAGRS